MRSVRNDIVFRDRHEAGMFLAEVVASHRFDDILVMGLPRGGVPVAAVVAEQLGVPLDVIVVRKLGLPGRPEVAMGAIGEDGSQAVDSELIAAAGVSEAQLSQVIAREQEEMARRVDLFRHGRPPLDLTGRTVVIVDDGVATGSTAEVACIMARKRGARRVVVAAPVVSPRAIPDIAHADDVVFVIAPERFGSVGEFYARFDQTDEDEVVRLLDRSARRGADTRRTGSPVTPSDVAREAAPRELRDLARPLRDAADVRALAEHAAHARYICIGEASHGTHEFYRWRGTLTRELIDRHEVLWIGVEGDWPDCSRINRWVKGLDDQNLDAGEILARFERWPRWMWANEDVAEFLDWLHGRNLEHPPAERVGFYGLDVYSLWESLDQVISWLSQNSPEDVGAAMRAWRCFEPFGEDPQRYAWASRLVPESCERDVVGLLARVRHSARPDGPDGPGDAESRLDAVQNALVAANAEHYYRVMMRADRESWNIRDTHMADTAERLADHTGPASHGVIWAHNTHIGDARGTSMVSDGEVNLGQLLRERHGLDQVYLIGFAAHRGSVLAGTRWGAPETVFTLPKARGGSIEEELNAQLPGPSVLIFSEAEGTTWLSEWRGHRAVGVVYNPDRESGNYVPTVMAERYDALLWIPETTALVPLAHEGRPRSAEWETEPTGF